MDQANNADWVDAIDTLVAAKDRGDCSEPLVREMHFDQVALEIASSNQPPQDLTVNALWKTASSTHFVDDLAPFTKFLNDQAPVCTWRHYGIGVDGDPGVQRTAVLLLAE